LSAISRSGFERKTEERKKSPPRTRIGEIL
jgi:hypothetical protein